VKLQSKFAALFNAKSAAAQQKRLCTTPNLPAQDLAPVFNANFDRRTKNKNAPSYKRLLYKITHDFKIVYFVQIC